MATTFLQFLVALVSLNCFVNTSLGSGAEFIKTSCAKTRFPDLCSSTLLSEANKIQTGPRLLVHTALDVALTNARSAAASMEKLYKSSGLQGVQDCMEVLSESQESLSKSINEMANIKPGNAGLSVSNIQTWVSAALTSQSTCADEFEGQASVKAELQKVNQLTSNALALVNTYSTSLA